MSSLLPLPVAIRFGGVSLTRHPFVASSVPANSLDPHPLGSGDWLQSERWPAMLAPACPWP